MCAHVHTVSSRYHVILGVCIRDVQYVHSVCMCTCIYHAIVCLCVHKCMHVCNKGILRYIVFVLYVHEPQVCAPPLMQLPQQFRENWSKEVRPFSSRHSSN